MAKTPEQLDELLKLVQDEDMSTLRALDTKLHLLLEQRDKDEASRGRGKIHRDELLAKCSRVAIDPDLLALVGIHPESPVEEDKALIRESIARRLTD
jgi:hypothetical protein